MIKKKDKKLWKILSLSVKKQEKLKNSYYLNKKKKIGYSESKNILELNKINDFYS